MFPPNKHTKKVKSDNNKKPPGKKLGLSSANNKYISSRWKYQHFHSCYALYRTTDFFKHNIFGIYLKKVTIFYVLCVL